jgi:hypothetical protein
VDPRAHGGGWRLDAAFSYGSAVERDASATSYYLLDAEVFRADLGATRHLGGRGFVALRSGVSGSNAGVLDAFFDAYHGLIRYHQRARAVRPRNAFAYLLDLPGRPAVEHRPVRLALDDLRLTLGARAGGALQGALVATAPTGTGPEGYARRAPSVGAAGTLRLPAGARGVAELGAALGATPRRGPQRELQRARFYALSSGLRLRVRGSHGAYGTLFYHSPTHQGTGLPEFDGRELTADFGWLATTRGGRAWHVGLAEDFGPMDASIDLALRAGVSW